MNHYLEPTDDRAFEDYPLQDPLKAYDIGLTIECPQCKGHGGWNLTLNAYHLHGKENTPENRHLFSHFRASCSHCHGHGYVAPEDAGHIHDWQRAKPMGRCLNLYECSICKKAWIVDSSD
jgi:hypothetical protein